MKILQVNNVYNQGSTGKIVSDIHTKLNENGIVSVVCYGRGKKVNEPNVYKVCGELYSKLNNVWSRITGLMYGGCLLSTSKLISIIKKEKPDIVHLQCINGYFINIYRLITWLKKNRIKTIITIHAEFMYTANCGYSLECEKWKMSCGHCPRRKAETKSLFFDGTHKSWKKMARAFDGFDDDLIIASVSPWLMERAKQSPILANKKHCVVMNGLNTDVFHLYDTLALRQEYGLTNKKVIFHATPSFNDNINHIKGGYYVLKLAEMINDGDVKFVVAGNCADGLKVPDNVILLGNVANQVLLAKLYSMADITLLTSKKETFSMVTAESLCCGTPVVGFKAGAPEMIALPQYSRFVEYGDLESLKDVVMQLLAEKNNAVSISNAANENYSKEVMTAQYLKIYNEMMTK